MTENKWQLIETAPRDRRLLLWTGLNIHCGQWGQQVSTGEEAFIVAEFGDEGDQLLVLATHWQPLPEPPVVAVD